MTEYVIWILISVSTYGAPTQLGDFKTKGHCEDLMREYQSLSNNVKMKCVTAIVLKR